MPKLTAALMTIAQYRYHVTDEVDAAERTCAWVEEMQHLARHGVIIGDGSKSVPGSRSRAVSTSSAEESLPDRICNAPRPKPVCRIEPMPAPEPRRGAFGKSPRHATPAVPTPSPALSIHSVLNTPSRSGPSLVQALRHLQAPMPDLPMPEGLARIERSRHWLACTEQQKEIIEGSARRLSVIDQRMTVWADGHLVCARVRDLRHFLRS